MAETKNVDNIEMPTKSPDPQGSIKYYDLYNNYASQMMNLVL